MEREVKKAIIINEDPSRASISSRRNSEALPDSLGPEAENSPTARKDKSSLCMSVPEHEHLHGGSYAWKSQGYVDVGWNAGLKTGIYYYLRSRGKAKAQQFTIEPENMSKKTGETQTRISLRSPSPRTSPLSVFLALHNIKVKSKIYT
jgi:hypothetical protein